MSLSPATLSPATSASSASLAVSNLDIANHPDRYTMAANSQIAWLASLNPQFDSPTGDQKFLRKVSKQRRQQTFILHVLTFLLLDLYHWYHWTQDQQRRDDHQAH